MIAGGRRHLATPAHHHHVTLALLLHAMHVSGPTAVNTLLLQSKSNTPGRFSPREKRHSRERSYSQSPVRPRSPPYEGPHRSRSRSPPVDRSPPPYNGSRSPSRSHVRDRRGAPRDSSRSPMARGYSRAEADADVSPSP